MNFLNDLAKLDRIASAAAAASSNSNSTDNNDWQQQRGQTHSSRPHHDNRRRGRGGHHTDIPFDHRTGARNHRSRHHNNNHVDRPRDRDCSRSRERHAPGPTDRPDSLEYLRRCFRVDHFRPVIAERRPENRPFHLALLVLTIDDLPYEHLWREWARTGTNNVMVSLVCHAKHPDRVQSPWLKRRLLVKPPRIGRGNSYADPEYFSHHPKWGSIELTRAMIDLLVNAMKIGMPTSSTSAPNLGPDTTEDLRFSTKRYWMESKHDDNELPKEMFVVDNFIFVSESCIPVKSLYECEQELYAEMALPAKQVFQPSNAKDEVQPSETSSVTSSSIAATASTPTVQHLQPWQCSWVNARSRKTPGTPTNKYERDQFAHIHRMIPDTYRYKADQFLMLSRAHAAAVLDMDRHLPVREQLWTAFSQIAASDEMYFPTALALLGILKDDETNVTSNKQNESSNNKEPLQVFKRQVTYIDWSEGMRHPACFSDGLKDFKKIARKARKQGSFFARKFVPFIDVPGQDRVITGQITVEEWRLEIESMGRDEAIWKEREEKMASVKIVADITETHSDDA